MLNDQRQAVLGVGDGIVSIDGTVIGRGGCAQWLYRDGRAVIYCGHDPNPGGEARGWSLLVYETATAQTTNLGVGGNSLAASAGRWACQTNAGLAANFALTPDGVMFSATMRMSLVDTDGRGAIGPNGEIGLCADPSCTTLIIYAADGSAFGISAVAYFAQILGPRQAIWAGGQYGVAYQLAPGAGRPRVALVADVAWLIYAIEWIGLVAHAAGELAHARLLNAAPTYFHYDVLGGDTLTVQWSTGVEEAPGELYFVPGDARVAGAPIDLTAPRVSFAFSHPVLVAPFKDPLGQSASPAEVVVNQAGQTARRPYIVADDSLDGPFAGARLGIYTEHADVRAAVTLAAGLATRVFACHDGPDAFPVTTLAQLRPWDVPLLECYLVAGETTPFARWTANLGALLAAWPGQVGVIPMYYCGGGGPPNETFAVDDVLQGLTRLSGLVNLSPRVTVIAPFAYLRANGITAHPELMDAFSALLVAAAQAGLATLPDVPVPPTPKPPVPPPVPPAPPTTPRTPYPAARVYRSLE